MKKIIILLISILVIPDVLGQNHWGRGDGLVLLFPQHNEVINTTSINFEWVYQYADEASDLNYEMIIGEYIRGESKLEKQAIDRQTNNFSMNGFLRGKTYQWRVICKDGGKIITWVDGLFTISEYKKNDNLPIEPCRQCNGAGKILVPESNKTCPKCNGSGRIDWGGGKMYKCEYPMGLCNGTGKVKVPAHYVSCSFCDGTGDSAFKK